MRKLEHMQDVSERTGVPVKTLEHWRHRGLGEGPLSFKLGRRVVYLASDVDQWIEDQRRAAVEFVAQRVAS